MKYGDTIYYFIYNFCILFTIFSIKIYFVIIVYICSIEFLSNANYKGNAGKHSSHYCPVHPSIANVLEEEHTKVNDAHQGPEESHHSWDDSLTHGVGHLTPQLQEERGAGVVDGAAGYGGDGELGEGEREEFHDEKSLPTVEAEGHTEAGDGQFSVGTFQLLGQEGEEKSRERADYWSEEANITFIY